MVYGQYPLVFIKGDQNGVLVPSGLAEASAIPFLSATVLVVSSISAIEYQGLNVTAEVNFTGVLSIGTTGTGIDLALTGDPQNPVIRTLSVGLSNFIAAAAGDTITIGWGGTPLDWSHGGTNSNQGPTTDGSVTVIQDVGGGVLKPYYPTDFTFDGASLSIPAGGKYQIGGTELQIPVNIDDLADVQITSPTNNQVITWDTGVSKWINKNNVAGGTTIPNSPTRIPYIVNTTTLAAADWFTIETGPGRVNVCSVCAADSAYATTFVEGGSALSTKYLTKAVADTYYQPTGNYQPCDVTLTEISTNSKVTVSRGGTGLSSLSPTGAIFYAGDSTTVSLTPAPQNNKYLKWNGTAYIWDSPTGTGVVINNQPGRVPFIIDSANLGDSDTFKFDTGTGRVNVCSVCAADSAYATTFVEGGSALDSKYLKITDAATTYLDKATYTTFTGTLGDLAFLDQVNLATTSVTGTLSVSRGGTGLTTLTADTFLVGNGTSISFIPTGSFETTAHANTTFLTKSEFTTFTGTTLGDLAYSDQVNLTTTSVTGTLSISKGGTGVTTLGTGFEILYVESGGNSINKGGYFNGTTFGAVNLAATSLSLIGNQLNHNLKIDLATTSVTGSLNVENGGTGQTALTAGSFVVGNGTTAVSLIPTGSFETTSYSRTNFATIASLNSYVLTSTYSTFTGTLGDLAFIDQVNLATTSVTGTLPIANGGTGKPSFNADQLIYGNNFSQNSNLTFVDGTTLKSVNVCGTSVCATTIVEGGQTLSTKYLSNSDFTTFTGTTLKELAYKDRVDLGTTSVTGTLTVSRGGTGLTSLTPTGLLYAANSTTITQTPAPSTNTYLKWNGTAYTWDIPTTGAGTVIPTGTYPWDGVYVYDDSIQSIAVLQAAATSIERYLQSGQNGIVKWVAATEIQNLLEVSPPPQFQRSASATSFSGVLIDELSSVNHYNSSSLINYAEIGTLSATNVKLNSLSAITISATTYLNLPSSTVVWASATNAISATDAYNAERVRKYVKNTTGSTIAKGRAVTVVSATGDNALVAPLSSVNTHVPEAIAFSNHVFGLTETQILNDNFGYIITEGLVAGTGGGVDALDTSLFSVGDILYVSSNGLLSNVRPPAPYEAHPIGYVIRSHANVGSIYVKVETVPEINDIVGFNLASSLVNGDLITYDLTTSTFVNKQSIDVTGLIKGGSVSATNLSATNARITSLSATTVSATTYQNLPTAALSGLSDVLITSPALSSVLKWNGTKWVPATDQTGGGSPVGGQYAIQVDDGAGGFYGDTTVTYDYDAAKVFISTSNLQVDSIATFNNSTDFTQPVTFTTIQGNSVSSTTVSATTYLNLPSGVATWNANKLQGVNISTATPATEDTLVYNGTAWAPKSVIAISNIIGNNLISS